ncbi:epoxide hydrolase 4-like [Dermacentor variabilis]|uniref:epoxide hydrolase 4-like n=1 Tax=Dermacentor variabilis TaxID=34621 RepID=UPI003F5C518A
MRYLPTDARIAFLVISTIMTLTMLAYVKLQIYLNGEDIMKPKHRTQPPEFGSRTFGEHRYVNLSNITVHYMTKGCDDVDGNRTMLLLLHGFPDFWFIWNRQIPQLSTHFCVVVPDLRGCGNTTRPAHPSEYFITNLIQDAREFIATLNPNNSRQLVFVGHGWGGMIGFCFVTLHGNLVHRMIVINGYHPLAFVKQLQRSLIQMMMSWYTVAFRVPSVPEQYMTIKDFAFFDYILWDSSTAEEVNATKYVYSKPGALTGVLNYYRAFNYDSEQLMKLEYRKIDVPTLILWSEKDRYMTTPIAEFNREHLRTSSVVYYPDGGHWLMRQCADNVNRRIIEFASTGNIAFSNNVDPSQVPLPENKCAESPKPSKKS